MMAILHINIIAISTLFTFVSLTYLSKDIYLCHLIKEKIGQVVIIVDYSNKNET